MTIDTALARVQQIISMQQQLLDPSAASRSTNPAVDPTTAPSAASAPATGAASTGAAQFSAALATAQATAAAAPSASAVHASGYVNPLADAHVRAERIDQGVDYAGSGTLGAIGPGIVTEVVKSGSGWEGGGYVEYKLTAGPYAGHSVYYAEGVTPTVAVGQTLAPGQPVATIIPGFPTGMELGFAAGMANQTSYATAYGGGYRENALTAAGQAFSALVASLGGPAGLTEGRTVTGSFR
jgi:hypothetical protein